MSKVNVNAVAEVCKLLWTDPVIRRAGEELHRRIMQGDIHISWLDESESEREFYCGCAEAVIDVLLCSLESSPANFPTTNGDA